MTALLIVLAVLILVGFSTAMLATLSKLIELDSTTPRYKRSR